MFYSDAILARRGPLARVWLAAHMERKLSKTQALQTDIEESVDIIINERIEIMALRLSGQLLLGVTRIYSRKAKYLLDDCSEALNRIKMTFFRPGIVVDMTADQATVDKNAITLRPMGELDLLLPDVNWDWEFTDLDLDLDQDITQPAPPYTWQAIPAADLTLGPPEGISSGDYSEVGVGRRRMRYGSEPSVYEPFDVERGVSELTPSVGGVDDGMGMGVEGFGFEFEGMERMDLGELGIGFEAQPPPPFEALEADGEVEIPFEARQPPAGVGEEEEAEMPPLVEYVSSPIERGLSPLPAITPSPPPLREPPSPAPSPSPVEMKKRRRRREKPQVIDTVIERSPFDVRDVSDITTSRTILPRSALHAKLLQIREDPIGYFVPAPMGLPPALSRMFRASPSVSPPLVVVPTVAPVPLEGGVEVEEEEVEMGRRVSRVPSAPPFGFPSSPPGPPISFPEMGPPSEGTFDFAFPPPPAMPEVGVMEEEERGVVVGLPPPRAVSMAPSVSAAPSLVLPESEVSALPEEEVDLKGLLRRELKVDVDVEVGVEGEGEEKVVTLRDVVAKVKPSRHVASSFFYQLLVLGTKDCVKVSQDVAYGDIEVTAKESLWEDL